MRPTLRTAVTVITASLLATSSALAQIKPGEYLSGDNLGVLNINQGKGGTLQFQLSTRGPNFHTCTLSGVIRNGEARMEHSSDEKLPCIVTFKPGKTSIDVASRHERTCTTYCGARASFEATYTLAPAGCAPSEIRQIRNRFKAAYDKKSFAEAIGLLSPIVEKCTSSLTEFDEGWVRNDLALTQHRAGNNAACRNTLKPWLELAQTPDAAILENYLPSDGAEHLRLAVATRTNMKLCGAPVRIDAKSVKPAK